MALRRIAGLVLMVALALVARHARAEATVSADGSRVEDEALGVRIARPAADWTLLEAAGARRLHPEAVAGARDRAGTRAVLLLHEGDEDRLTVVGDAVLAGLRLDDRRVVQDVEVIFDGARARRILLEGRQGGAVVGYRITLTARGGTIAEMRAWRPGAGVMQAYVDLAQFERSVRFLPTFGASAAPTPTASPPASPRPTTTPLAKSGAYGFALAPAEGWRLADEDELLAMHAEAEMGLIHGETEAYVVVLAEHATADAASTVADELRRATAARLGDAEGTATVAQAFAAPLTLDRYAVDGEPPLTFLHGATSRDDTVVQVLGWFPSSLGASGAETVVAALGGLRWLGGDEATLAEVLERRERSRRAEVGADWALRGVQYLDFAYGLRLRVKETTDWRLWAGGDADARVEGARLVLDSPSRGCRVALIPEPGLGLPSAVYHQAAAKRLLGAQRPDEPTLGALGGLKTRSSAGTSDDVPPTWWQLTTGTHRGVAIQILASGLAVAREDGAAAAEEALAALTFPEDGVPVSKEEDGVLIDERFGFRLDARQLRGGLRDVTPAGWEERGRIVTTALGEARLFLAAYGPAGEAGSAEADSETFLGVLEAELATTLPSTFARTRALLARRPAERLVLSAPTRRVHLFRLERGDLTYVLAYAWDPRRSMPPVGQEARFELIR